MGLGLGHRRSTDPTRRVSPGKAVYLGRQRWEWAGILIGSQEQQCRSRKAPGMFEEGRPLVFAVQGLGAWLDHPGRPRCQAGKPGCFSLCRGPSTYPESSYPCIRSLVAWDLCKVTEVTHEAWASARKTSQQGEGSPHLPHKSQSH